MKILSFNLNGFTTGATNPFLTPVRANIATFFKELENQSGERSYPDKYLKLHSNYLPKNVHIFKTLKSRISVFYDDEEVLYSTLKIIGHLYLSLKNIVESGAIVPKL
ncbi:MAG: hypothetical protein LBE27_04850, partial [Deltaproteobacteria bacterium]|nr:hypothetical protein [Deltaproteobacteria bacterium]